jgi:hypothetical protein
MSKQYEIQIGAVEERELDMPPDEKWTTVGGEIILCLCLRSVVFAGTKTSMCVSRQHELLQVSDSPCSPTAITCTAPAPCRGLPQRYLRLLVQSLIGEGYEMQTPKIRL